VRGGNERNETAAPRRIRCRDVNADHGPLLYRDRVNASELGDQVAEVRLVPDEEEGVVTASSEELGDVRRSRSVSKVLVNSGGGL
jgi:hypothetical protein